MKKFLLPLLGLCIAIGGLIFYFTGVNNQLEYEVISRDELSKEAYQELVVETNVETFNIYEDENYSYVYYKPDHLNNEYITTDLLIEKEGEDYIFTGKSEPALNDDEVSYEKIIKFNKIPVQNIVFREN